MSSVIARCEDRDAVEATVKWFVQVCDLRPAFELCLIAFPEDCVAPLAALSHPVVCVVAPTELVDGAIAEDVLDRIRSASIEGQVLDNVLVRYGDGLLDQLPLTKCLIAHAVRGGTVGGAAREYGTSVDTIARRLERIGVLPRELMRAARLFAYDIHRENGSRVATALAACGWNDPEHVRRARIRDQKVEERG